MRGEDAAFNDGHEREPETPPHAWGRLSFAWVAFFLLGNTPTCVGKTVRFAQSDMTQGKHPHMRGEDPSPDAEAVSFVETPPHAWGRRLIEYCTNVPNGNTPTCVGKTYSEIRRFFYGEKHPHMRGEDTSPGIFFRFFLETPPHAWGRLFVLLEVFLRHGNTPTCVGKTHALRQRGRVSEKHPHMRGEDHETVFSHRESVETPPHAWGRQTIFDRYIAERRNTPTCVGKTASWCISQSVQRKHPHMRGEDLSLAGWRVNT